jgi:hypothetical protein
MLRKLLVWVLLLPLPMNGLWMACRDTPQSAQAAEQPSSDSAQADDNLFDHFGDVESAGNSADENTPADCKTICPIDMVAKSAGFCLIAPDGKASLAIVVFGVAVLPATVQLQSPEPIHAPPPLYSQSHLSPSLDQTTPPPRA